MYYYFHCPKCDEELVAEVDIGDHMVDWSEECDICGHKFTEEEKLKVYNDALEDCFSSMIDHAHERLRDL